MTTTTTATEAFAPDAPAGWEQFPADCSSPGLRGVWHRDPDRDDSGDRGDPFPTVYATPARGEVEFDEYRFTGTEAREFARRLLEASDLAGPAVTEAPFPDADQLDAWATALRNSSRAATLDAYQYAVARAEAEVRTDGDLYLSRRDAYLFAWVRGFLLDDALDDRPEGIVARTRGVADAFAELRKAGAL